MNTNRNPSPEDARNPSGEASAPAGHSRARGWRPRTIRAKVSIGAVAAAGATGLALALVAGPAGAATKPVWTMTAGNVQTLSQTDPSIASYFFNTPAAYGEGASLVHTPVQAGYATTPVLSYTSYAQFASDIQSGAITYPYKWVMYDPEEWSATPVSEQQDPARYMTLFGQLAHAHGLKVIQAPALDLAYVTGSVLPRQPGETADQWYIRVNIAGSAAAAGDIFVLQDESNTTAGGSTRTCSTRPRPRRRPRTPASRRSPRSRRPTGPRPRWPRRPSPSARLASMSRPRGTCPRLTSSSS